MIKILCDKCDNELNEKGALIFSPPQTDENGYDICQKYNICIDCYKWLIEVTEDKPKKKKVRVKDA